jgi:hypothetical protein
MMELVPRADNEAALARGLSTERSRDAFCRCIYVAMLIARCKGSIQVLHAVRYSNKTCRVSYNLAAAVTVF